MRVAISANINTPQEFLNKEDVEKYMSSRQYNGIKAIKYKSHGKDTLMLVDGNHRYVAAKLNHEKSVKMRIIEI